jgi:XTP/dITP diphosphohydrolase
MQNKKIKKLLIGTNNKGKLREIRALLPKNIKTFSPQDFKLRSPKENGKTFKENSYLKAKFFSKKTKMICLADDSGLEIDKLNKSPGIYSARWGGKKNNFNLAISRVYKKLNLIDKNWKKKKIKCRFVCSLTLYWPNKKPVSRIGKIVGYISPFRKGKNGFGYDPIFIPKGKKKTFGEMKPRDKYNIDHRIRAFKKIKKFF